MALADDAGGEWIPDEDAWRMARRRPRGGVMSLHMTTRTTFAAVLLSVIALIVLAPSAHGARATTAKPTVVLVHGAWADASSWNRVTARLQQHGYRVLAPANPLRALDGDAGYLRSILAQVHGPLLVVGHSYGGAVITNAAAGNPDVRGLVYVNGFVPDVGEDILHLAGADSLVPSSIEFKGFPPFGPTDVDIYIKPESFRETLAGDVPKQRSAVLAATQRPLSLAAASGPTAETAWRTLPSWYVLGTEDRTITPSAQRLMAERAGARIVHVKASHLSLISRPGVVADVIEHAARATGGS